MLDSDRSQLSSIALGRINDSGSKETPAHPSDLWEVMDRFRQKVRNDPRIKPELDKGEMRVSAENMGDLGYTRPVRNCQPENLLGEIIDLINVDYPVNKSPLSLRLLFKADGMERKLVNRVILNIKAGRPTAEDDEFGGEFNLDDGMVLNFRLKRDAAGMVQLEELFARGAAVKIDGQVVLDNEQSEIRNGLVNNYISGILNDNAKIGNMLGGIRSVFDGIDKSWSPGIEMRRGMRYVLVS